MNKGKQQIHQIDIDLIEVSSGTQSRVGLDETKVDEYTEAMEKGANFPLIDVFILWRREIFLSGRVPSGLCLRNCQLS